VFFEQLYVTLTVLFKWYVITKGVKTTTFRRSPVIKRRNGHNCKVVLILFKGN